MTLRERMEMLITRVYALGQLWMECPERREDTHERFAALKAEALAMVPEGWKLVPIEPDVAMHIAGTAVRKQFMELNATNVRRICDAMLGVAPQAPGGREGKEKKLKGKR